MLSTLEYLHSFLQPNWQSLEHNRNRSLSSLLFKPSLHCSFLPLPYFCSNLTTIPTSFYYQHRYLKAYSRLILAYPDLSCLFCIIFRSCNRQRYLLVVNVLLCILFWWLSHYSVQQHTVTDTSSLCFFTFLNIKTIHLRCLNQQHTLLPSQTWLTR